MQPHAYICPICRSRALRFTNPANAYWCPECGIVSGSPLPYYDVTEIIREELSMGAGIRPSDSFVAAMFSTPDYMQSTQPAYERRTEDDQAINFLIYTINREYGPSVRYGTAEPERTLFIGGK